MTSDSEKWNYFSLQQKISRDKGHIDVYEGHQRSISFTTAEIATVLCGFTCPSPTPGPKEAGCKSSYSTAILQLPDLPFARNARYPLNETYTVAGPKT